MRVRMLKGPDKGQIRDMGTMMARRALKAGSAEMVAKNVCQLCGGLFAEVPTLATEPNAYRCQVCGSPAHDRQAPVAMPEDTPKPSRRSSRARRAASGADE